VTSGIDANEPKTAASVPRLNDDGAERCEVSVGRAPIVHRDREEPSGAERFAVRSYLFQMPPKRLFAFVDAADDL